MSYKDFYNDFNKEITRDWLVFSGAEDYLMERAIDQIIDRYVDEDSRSIDVKHLDGDRVSAYEILAEAKSYSMFSARRVVIVRNFLPLYRKSNDMGLDALLSDASMKLDSSVVVFVLESRFSKEVTSWGKKLMKTCGNYDFARLAAMDLKRFINKRMREGGKILDDKTMDYLIDLSGYYNNDSTYKLTQLNLDIAKIVKASEEDVISPRLIEEILIGDSDKFVFNLVDSITSGNIGRAIDITEAIIREEDNSMAVLALLTKQFEIMYDVTELADEGHSFNQMSKLMGVNEYRLKKAYEATRRYRQERIKKLLIDLYNIDRDIRKGDIERDIALELFVLSAARR